jgi:hypothetical protein
MRSKMTTTALFGSMLAFLMACATGCAVQASDGEATGHTSSAVTDWSDGSPFEEGLVALGCGAPGVSPVTTTVCSQPQNNQMTGPGLVCSQVPTGYEDFVTTCPDSSDEPSAALTALVEQYANVSPYFARARTQANNVCVANCGFCMSTMTYTCPAPTYRSVYSTIVDFDPHTGGSQ